MKNKEAIEYLGKIPIPRLMSNTLEDCTEQNNYCLAIKMAIKALENQKTGHWIKREIEDTMRWKECSECHSEYPNMNGLNYCPNCGAKMEGE